MPQQNFTIEYGLTVGNANITGSSGNIETSGNISASSAVLSGNLSVTGVSNLGNIGNVIITGGTNGYAIITDGAGNLSWTSIDKSGTVNSGTATQLTYYAATGNTVSETGANLTWNGSDLLSVTGNISATNISGTITTAAQPNITSVGTLSSLSVTGNVSAGNLSGTTLTGNVVSVGTSSFYDITVSNLVSATSNVDSSSTSTGAIVTAGGLGVAKNAYFGQDVNIGGNLNVTGNTTIVNANDITIADKTFILANNASSGALADGAGLLVGNISITTIASWLYHHATTSWQTNIDLTPTGNVTLNLGDPTLYWNNLYTANVYGTIQTAAQPNITSVGTLGSLSVTGNVSAGNLSGTFLSGTLTTAAQPNITSVGTLSSLSVTGNVSAGNLSGTFLSGTLETAAQPNITSVGTLSSLSVSGNVSAGNLSATLLTGTLTTAAQPNITSVGSLSSLSVSGNANVGNIGATNGVFTNISVNGTSNFGAVGNITITGGTSGQFIQTDGAGNLSFATIDTNVISNGTSNVLIATANGNVTTSVAGTANVLVITSTGANVTGTFNSSGNANVGNIGAAKAIFTSTANVADTLTVNTSNIATAIANGATAGVGNIGAAGQGFDTLFARQASANYADLAEIYAADGMYEYGTVMVFAGTEEVTVSTQTHDSRIAGVVSQQPAFWMNDTASGVPIALTGRVPCRVLGPVGKGTLLVSSNLPGIACAVDPARYQPGCVIGKSLENIDSASVQLIEVVVGRL